MGTMDSDTRGSVWSLAFKARMASVEGSRAAGSATPAPGPGRRRAGSARERPAAAPGPGARSPRRCRARRR